MIEFESIGYVDVQYNLLTERFTIYVDGECVGAKDKNITGYLFKPTFATYYFNCDPKVTDKVLAKFPKLRAGEYDDYVEAYGKEAWGCDGIFTDGDIEDVVRYIRLLEKRVA